MSLSSHATPEATSAFAQQFSDYAADAFRKLGRTNLTISKLGFGTYRCQQENELHFHALQSALRKGCNIIDTSANYGDGSAEALIGEVLNQEIVWGNLQRESMVLVSKAGYIQGENLEIAQKREQDGKPFPEVVKYGQGIWHCIHPYFIRDQITRTLSRLHVDTLDVYLLHNPEYFLMHAAATETNGAADSQEEFYHRIYNAFVEQEKLVEQGLICWYGISSNTFIVDNNRPDFVSLSRVWQVYERMCSEKGISTDQGHFAVVQFPFNWIEHQAFTLKNNTFEGAEYTVLELAKKLNLGALINRPLNAIDGNRLIRLARYSTRGADHAPRFKEELKRLMEVEKRLTDLIEQEKINMEVNREVSLKNIFQNADTLRKLNLQEIDVSQLNQLITHYFLPLFKIGERALLKKTPREKRESARAMMEGYFNQFNLAAKALRDQLDELNYQRTKPLEQRFDALNPERADRLTLSQKALSVAAAAPGVDVVLNGMRTPAYVDDSMDVLGVDGIEVQNLFDTRD